VNVSNTSRISIEQTLAIAEEKIAGATTALDRIRVEQHTLVEREESSHTLQDELSNEKAHIQPRIDDAKAKDDILKKAFEGAVEKYRNAKNDHDVMNQKHMELLNRLSDLNHQKSHQEAALTQHKSSIEHLKTKKGRLGKSQIEFKKELDLVAADFKDAEIQYKSLESKVSELETAFTTLQSELNETRETLAKKRGRRVSIENQLNFYEELMESGEGYSGGVRTLLREDTEKLGILGTVADLLTVDERYEKAIQTALGPLAEALVTQDRNSALAAIRALKAQKAGSATFLPLDPLLKAKSKSSKALSGKHVIGAALDFVTPKKGFENLAELLLKDLTLVEDDFVADWDKIHGRAVTVDGTLYDTIGLVRGGTGSEGEDTLIGRQDRIQRLRKQYSTLVDEIQEHSLALEKIHEKIGSMERELRTSKASRDDQRQILLEVERKTSRAQYGINQTEADTQSVDQEISELVQAIADAEERIAAFAPQLAETEATRVKTESQISAMETCPARAFKST